MTVNQLATAAGSDRKWLVNSAALLGRRRLRATPSEARWWGLVRVLTLHAGMVLEAAARAATSALRGGNERGKGSHVRVEVDPGQSATLLIDLDRYDSIFLGNLSAALVLETPKRRGRRTRAKQSPLVKARNYGVDLGLVRAALARTPAQRLATLEANAEFVRQMRRAGK